MTQQQDDTFGRYGKANGNGPWHLMVSAESGWKPRCGVTRSSSYVRRHPPEADICRPCRAAERRERRGEVTEQALAQLAEEADGIRESVQRLQAAKADLQERTGRMRKLFPSFRDADRTVRDGLLLACRSAGMTLQEVGDLFGLTREAVRQRLAKLNAG